MRRGFLKEHRGEFGPIGKACGTLRVPESEYHGYVKRRKPDAQIEWEALEGFVAERLDLCLCQAGNEQSGTRNLNSWGC